MYIQNPFNAKPNETRHVKSRLTWKGIEEVINFIFINDSNLCWASWAAYFLQCFTTNRTCFPPALAFYQFWTILLQDFITINLAVYNKNCPVLGDIFFVPTKRNQALTNIYIFWHSLKFLGNNIIEINKVYR